MINILRKNQKGLWIVIACLCIPFVFYFSKSDFGAMRNNEAGKIYGRSVSVVELQRSARLFNLARDLGMSEFLQSLVAGASSLDQAYTDFTWNRFILHHEAERLGIRPTQSEITQAVKNMSAFQGEKGFDISKFNAVSEGMLPSLGFSEAQIEELAADQLTLQKLKALVGAGVQVADTEMKEDYERAYGKLDVSLVRLRTADFAKDIQVSDDEVGKYFEAHKAALQTEEMRKVSLAAFALTDEQKKLTGKERVEPLQKLADKANDFNQALLEKGADFDQVAAKIQVPIQTSGEFSRITPDPIFKGLQQLSNSAFQLTAQEPNSDAIQIGDSFYILHLVNVEAPKPLTLEEAKPKIVQSMKAERESQLLTSKGAEAAQKIREALKSGAPADQAIQKAGLTAEKVPPFSLVETPKPKAESGQPPEPVTPDLQMIKSATAELGAGEVSDFIQTQSGGFVALVAKRELPENATADPNRASMLGRILKGKRDVTFYEWLRDRRQEAGVRSSAPEPIS